MRRAHYQAAIWRSCEAQDPPQESPEDFGWYKDDISGIMLPKFHDTSPVLAPEELLKLIRCQCKAMEGQCMHKKCSCREANVPYIPSFADVLLMARTVSVTFNIRQQQIRKTQIKIRTPQLINSQTFCQIVMTSNRDFELIVLKNINFISRMIQI